MDNQFFYEDGQGNFVNEHGWPKPVDSVVDEELYAIETVSSHTQYLQSISHKSKCESIVQDLVNFDALA